MSPGCQANLSQAWLQGSEGSAFLSLVHDVSKNYWKVFRLTLDTLSDGKALQARTRLSNVEDKLNAAI